MVVKLKFFSAIMIVLCGFLTQSAYAYQPRGWLWGDEWAKKTEPKKEETVDFASLSPDEQVALLRSYTLSAIHALDVDPSPEHAKAAAEWLDFWSGKATGVVHAYREMLLENPELDYHLAHPSESAALSVTKEQIKEKERQAILALSQSNGLLYFYEGKSPYTPKLSPIIEHFAAKYHISVIPVSVDGIPDGVFANTKMDNGQAAHLGVRHFPALILVNPQTQAVQPISYGFITEDALENRFYQVATGFKGETY